MTSVHTARPVGSLVKDWRIRRRRSQMDLALEAGVSPRHLSFVETGRSRPSPELLLLLADRLDVPLRERNGLLLAAGYAPRFTKSDWDDAAMEKVTAALQRLLAGHDPYPGLVVDRQWNVVLANRAAQRLAESLPTELVSPTMNVFRVGLHPDGLAGHTLNFREWAGYLLRQLHRLIVLTGDPEVVKLADEVAQYPNVAALGDGHDTVPPDEPAIVVPWRLVLGGDELSLFTTLATFGTPLDITLDELSIELFYPADERTESILRSR